MIQPEPSTDPQQVVTRTVIMGAAGRDFHNFNVVYRDDLSVEVVAFTRRRNPSRYRDGLRFAPPILRKRWAAYDGRVGRVEAPSAPEPIAVS